MRTWLFPELEYLDGASRILAIWSWATGCSMAARPADLRRLIDGLPDDQPLLIIDDSGMAAEVEDFEPATVRDQDGVTILTLEIITGETSYGFDPDDETRIDTTEE